MEDDITCNVCGGQSFFVEAGYYYCSECQTQSQEIRQQVFAVPEEATAARHTSFRRIHKKKQQEDQLTSWECYNYIILGLVNELIELGADPKLKRTVHQVWFTYLRFLEVISVNSNEIPKLPAVNYRRDAEIIYGRSKKKRKRTSRTPSPSSTSDTTTTTTLDAPSLRRERAKHRRSMVLSQYDELSTKQSDDVSLHNQSLLSLGSSSNASKEKDKYLKHNRSAKKELQKIMGKNHLRSHIRDVDSVLDCHRISYKSVTNKYFRGAQVISRSKIYSIIYLALLINRDTIGLSDILRYVKEGKLSYHSVDHFFPEEMRKKNLNIKFWKKGRTMLSHYTIRITAADIARELHIIKLIPKQSMAELLQRYCTELNLPDEIWRYAFNLISRAMPQMKIRKKSRLLPNLEGRIVSVLMFVVKLFFGLDDVTEKKYSRYAEKLNENSEKEMFVWGKWAYYIQYRKLVLMHHHFPTSYLFNNEDINNCNMFTKFITEQHSKYEEDDEIISREAEVWQQLLNKFKAKQHGLKPLPYFPVSLTPSRDYVKALLDSQDLKDKNYLTDVLKFDFTKNSLNFLVTPFSHLNQLNSINKVGIKHRGANNKIKIVKFPNFRSQRKQWRKAAERLDMFKLGKEFKNIVKSTDFLKGFQSVQELPTREILTNFKKSQLKSYKRNSHEQFKQFRKESSSRIQPIKFFDSSVSPTELFTSTPCSSEMYPSSQDTVVSSQQNESERPVYVHYIPCERYYLKNVDVENLTTEEFKEFFETFPDSFQLLLHECARITEQSPKELFDEFNKVEIYLSYVARFTHKSVNETVVDKALTRLIAKAKKNW